LKTVNLAIKNDHSVPEGHQCPGRFQEVGEIFQKSKIADVIKC